jgi:CRP-like cAMP-binding protein
MMTTVERVLLLQNIDVFSDVTTEQLSFFAAIAEEMTLSKGTTIYRENDQPDGFYVVISGTVAAVRNNEVIEKIGPGGSFGVWALFGDEPRLTDVAAVEASQLLFVGREEFYDVLSDHPEITQGIFKQFVHRLRRLTAPAEK